MALWSRRIALTCTPSPPFRSPFSVLFSPFSSPSPSSPETPLPPISLFLLTECHFSPFQISKIMQTRKELLKTRSPHTASEAVEFLKQWGFTQPQLHSAILRHPTVLSYKVDTQLKPKFHFFGTLGFTDQDFGRFISIYPKMLGFNLESNIIPKMSFLGNLFGTRPNLIKVLKMTPSLLARSIEKSLKPKLDFFKQCGIQGELLSLLLSTKPDILARCSMETLRVRMEYARKTTGIVQGSKDFISWISVCLSIGPQNMEKKVKHLRCLGFLEDEIRELLMKDPHLLCYSTNKMQENMDFLTQTAGLKRNVVFSNVYLLHFSVKKRLMPRHAVFKALSLEQQSVLSLSGIFALSERRFLEKIVECSPQASMLKKIYKGKMDSDDIRSI